MPLRARARHGAIDVRLLDGLQDVVDGCVVEGLDGEFVKGSHEHDQRDDRA